MIDRDKVHELGAPREGTCVSLYAPMHRAGAPTRENPIRFKNRIQEAERYLGEEGWGPKAIDELLAPARERIDDNDFWQHQEDGLAMFLADGEFHEALLPVEPPELTVIAPRFHLKPLLPIVTENQTFWVLVVSLNHVRLFRATRYGIEQAELPQDTATSLEEFDKYEAFEKSGHFETMQKRGPTNQGDQAIHYGTGDADIDASRRERLLRFFRQLDDGVREVVAGSEEPVVFAGVDSLFPLYREANKYPHLFEGNVEGNPDRWDPSTVHERAWEVIGQHVDQDRIEALQRYKHLVGSDNASDALDEIVNAAVESRVETLIVGLDAHRWGVYDPANRSVKLYDAFTADSYDLLDFAAIQTFRNGGTVYAIPNQTVPDGKDMVAIYRF